MMYELAKKFQVEITMSRVVGKQVHIMNIQIKFTKEYYETSIFIYYMD